MKDRKTKPSDLAEQIKKLTKVGSTDLSVNQIRVVIALERAVARLESDSSLREHLIFKGGFVLLKMLDSPRFTRDLDALAMDIDQKKVVSLAKAALSLDLEDGFWFVDAHAEELLDQGEYGGIRINCAFQIGTTSPDPKKVGKLSRIHIDIGFGDFVPKKIPTTSMPSLLGGEPISWRVYPIEFIFAEKLQTLISRGSANSRAKDVYDLVEIFSRCKNQLKLRQAIHDVFKNRKTNIPEKLDQEVGDYDYSILQRAWGSVDLGKEKALFEDYWIRLKKILGEIGKS